MKNRDRHSGYTLIELIVVILIIGILASFAVPQYLKTVETGKSDDAVAMVNMIGTTNKMFALDHSGVFVTGQFPATPGTGCGVAACAPGTITYPNPVSGACQLVYCKYLADQDWGAKPYTFYACDGNASAACAGINSGNNVSGAMRQSTAYAPYNTWGYTMNTAGVISANSAGTTVPPPTY